MRQHFSLAGLVIAALVLSGGCISFNGGDGGPSGTDGGVFKSTDAGNSWVQKVAIATADGSTLSFSGADVLQIVQDPQDPQAVYAATLNNGLLYTYNGGESWNFVRDFARQTVADVAVSYDDKCTLYAAVGNKIFKSDDCSRNWQEVYFDTRTDVLITNVETEWFNDNVIYAGTNTGEVLKSSDFGRSWQTIKRIQGGFVREIMIDANDSRIVYVATDKGLFRTPNGGVDWSDDSEETSINLALREFPNALKIEDIDQDVHNRGTIILATQFGLLRSKDAGQSWEEIPLITPAGGAAIESLAVDPANGNIIYYGTNTTLYKTVNGGRDWTSQKLPTGRAAEALIVNKGDSTVLYMGARTLED